MRASTSCFRVQTRTTTTNRVFHSTVVSFSRLKLARCWFCGVATKQNRMFDSSRRSCDTTSCCNGKKQKTTNFYFFPHHPAQNNHQQRHLSSSSNSNTSKQQNHYPVVIMGGGPTGLYLSLLLSSYGVRNVVLESQSVKQRFQHPQAHFLNTRTMEILKHYTPNVYESVIANMPHVHQWDSFRFGASMISRPLAVVQHPVHRPLQVHADHNGRLVDAVNPSEQRCRRNGAASSHHHHDDDVDLSSVTVGHLAQHKFGKIVYDYAITHNTCQLRYGCTVSSVECIGKLVHVECSDGSRYETDVVIGADGSNSLARAVCNIDMIGEENIQTLVNIHVTLPQDQADILHSNNNYAMLYSIYSDTVVAMVVCHEPGEYIIQIPIFKPYQCIETTFGPDKLPAMLQSIFGEGISNWTVHSVREWTMNSTIAAKYYHLATTNATSGGIVLAGDAAHVFPPAGGLGMNTGLQDAHNIAWRIAAHRSRPDLFPLHDQFVAYQEERRPIAQQNASLSVRNYTRLLEVMKALYLNEQHPQFLAKMLEASPLSLDVKRAVFQKLYETALFPLRWLKEYSELPESHPPGPGYASHVSSNLLKLLKQGQGLPLLFPNFELGYSYGGLDRDFSKPSGNSWRTDTIATTPKLCKGSRIPHVRCKVQSGKEFFPTLALDDDDCVSTADMPGQLSQPDLSNAPSFVLFWVLDDPRLLQNIKKQQISRMIDKIENKLNGFHIALVAVLHHDAPFILGDEGDSESNRMSSIDGKNFRKSFSQDGNDCDTAVKDDNAQPKQRPKYADALILCAPTHVDASPAFFFKSIQEDSYIVLVRPDGHVVGIVTNLSLDWEVMADQMLASMKLG